MTLTEVIVGLTLLAIVATSIIGITFQVRSKAEEAIYQNTSLTLAQGYMEQIRHLDYTTLRAVAQDTSSSVPLPLRNASGNAITPVSGTFFGNGTWSTETIYLDEVPIPKINPTDIQRYLPIQPVTFRFRAVLTSLETALSGLASGVEVAIYYQTTYNFGVTRTHNGSLRSVRSSVPSY
jgi:type II secretory pathway pseudopilin PulG